MFPDLSPGLSGHLASASHQALWMMEPKEISDWQHEEFYRYVAQTFDKPRYTLHYRADAPLNIRSIFYVPEAVSGRLLCARVTSSPVDLSPERARVSPTEADHVRREQRDGLQRGAVQQEGPDPDQSHRHPAQVAALPPRSRSLRASPPSRLVHSMHDFTVLEKKWLSYIVIVCVQVWWTARTSHSI